MESTTDNEGSDLLDPLADYSPLSLVSRSRNLFSSSTHHLSNPNSSISDSLYARLKARVLSSPNKLMKQAASILEGSLDHLQADKSEAVTDNEKVPRGRRPGLGLKRPKFSIKPMPSQPDPSLESSIDFDKLSDPDEYFDAFERMENAKKEVAKLKGEPLVDLDQYRASLAQKRRRPGLLGKSYTYTHRPYPSLPKVDADEILLPSQETYDNDILSPVRHDVVPDANVTSNSSSMRVSDSKATTTGKVSELDELLSCNFDGLDENGVQNLLLDKLQIKSVDISEDNLPDLRVSLRESLTTSTALPKSNETVSHLSGANLAASSKDMKSPANSRSPLASISMLNRHIAKRKPSDDLFPSLRFDSSPEKATNSTRETEKRVDQAGQSDENDARSTMCDVRSSPVHGEEDTAVTGEDPFVSVENGVDQSSEPKEKEVVSRQHDQIGNQTELREDGRSPVHGKEKIVGVDVNIVGVFAENGVDQSSEPKEKEVVSGQHDQIGNQTELREDGRSPVHGKENIMGVDVNIVGVFAENGVDQSSEPKEKEVVSGQHDQIGNQTELREDGRSPVHGEENIVGVDVGPASEPENQNDEVAAVRESAGNQPTLEAQDMENSNLNEDVPVSKETRSKRRKVERAGPGLRKGDRRFSLYCAGTSWDHGVRRSKRVRMAPLNFWKGERVYYGRVHETLPTVIGVKYSSPSKDGEPGVELKVKSFVSGKYKHLLDQVSSH